MLNKDQIQPVLETILADLEHLVSHLQTTKSNTLDVISTLNYKYGNYYADYQELYSELVSVESKLVRLIFETIKLINELKEQGVNNNP